ncbi:MAG TPA: hypothetical protein VN688_18500 [Gemmataceae bacterium]|nr:hypothetical protein [Gemmataceae bacterium]
MWICRRCAAHAKDEVLSCPCCAMPAPARLQPTLAENVSDELNESPRPMRIRWLSLKSLPNLRKQAQSPWVWALFGFVFGLGCGTVNFHGSLAQPILCGVALAVVFGVIGVNLRRCRRRGSGHPYPAEIGAIFGFFLPIIFTVIDGFTNHRIWEHPFDLFGNLILAAGCGVPLAALLAIPFGAIATALELMIDPLASRVDQKGVLHERPPHAPLMKTESLGQQPTADAEPSDKIITTEDQVFSQLDKRFGIRREDD